MRMRFKPYAGPELAACPFHMNDATRYKGRWRETFARPGQPLHLELGCGKGGFLARLASRNPDVNYIGVDITDKVLILAKRNIERIYAEQGLPIDNVKTLAHDIERIPTLLDKADRVERIYINFCNPWNKKANHKKHRLTHTRQLLLYRPFLADPDPAKMPILGDLYNELLKQPEPEAARIAAALELYVSGSLNVFNHRTNVELSNRLVCFDIKQLGKQLKKLGMLIVQDQVWNRVTVNRAEKKATRYYMDEFHLLLKEEQTAAYSVEIWKRFRKWGGIPTAITQNVKDLLSSREVENIFENSDFVLMLNQAQGDRAILAKQLNISPQQMKYVTHTEAGEGLIFYGNVVLPFIDRFPTDTELYRLLTTKPEEVSKP